MHSSRVRGHLAGGVHFRGDGDSLTLHWRSRVAMVSGVAIAAVSVGCIVAVAPHPIAWCLVPLAAAGLALASLTSSIRVDLATASPTSGDPTASGRLLSWWGPIALFVDVDLDLGDVRSIAARAGGDGSADVVLTLTSGEERVLAGHVSRAAADAIVQQISNARPRPPGSDAAVRGTPRA